LNFEYRLHHDKTHKVREAAQTAFVVPTTLGVKESSYDCDALTNNSREIFVAWSTIRLFHDFDIRTDSRERQANGVTLEEWRHAVCDTRTVQVTMITGVRRCRRLSVSNIQYMYVYKWILGSGHEGSYRHGGNGLKEGGRPCPGNG